MSDSFSQYLYFVPPGTAREGIPRTGASGLQQALCGDAAVRRTPAVSALATQWAAGATINEHSVLS